MPESGVYFMKRVLAMHIIIIQKCWCSKAEVAQTVLLLWNINVPGKTEIFTEKKVSLKPRKSGATEMVMALHQSTTSKFILKRL